MSASFPDDADAANDVVDAAARLVSEALDDLEPLLRDRSGGYRTSPKSDGTPVTATDLLVDERLTKAIAGAFPDHGVLSEEADTTWSGSDWTWILDPIDGTSNFASGLPYWAVSIALAHAGQVVYGCVSAPGLGERFVARRGRGGHLVTADGQTAPLRVREAVDFRSGRNSHVPIAVTAGTIRRSRGNRVHLNPRVLGAWALDLALVAGGRLIGSYATVPHVWDMAAGALLVEEAGGVARTVGRPLLPLRTDIDYAHTSAPLASGPSAAWVDDLLAQIA